MTTTSNPPLLSQSAVTPSALSTVANPTEVTLQDGPEPFFVHVHLAEGSEYDDWWSRSVAVFAPYADYKEKTQRRIPIFVATRVDG